MKKILTLSLLLAGLLLCMPARADEPFRKHRFDLFQVLPPAEGSIVFVGNSITDMHPWVEAFETADGQPLPIVNRGVSGTYSTEQSDNLESYLLHHPKKLFMMIGTNDIATSGGLNFQPEQVLNYVKSIVKRVHMRSPQTKVYLYSILKNQTGNRPAERWLRTNELVKAFVDETAEDWLQYIDLYDALSSVADGGVWSYDNLHLTAASYRIWCEAICPYLAEGEEYTVRTVYPADTETKQNAGGLSTSHGMRATYASMLPVRADDILFFGDEEVKCGEWNELFGTHAVKNRGTGWGYGGSVSVTSGIVDATFAETGVSKACPAAVLLYTGTAEVNGTTDMATVKADYLTLVNKLKANCPTAKIYLLGVHPVSNATTNTNRVAVLNSYLEGLADDQVRYIDTYTPFLSNGVADTRYIKNTNYLYALGYVKMAGLIAAKVNEDFPGTLTAPTETEAEALLEQAGLRNQLTQAMAQGMVAPVGTQMGEYSAEAMQSFQAAVDAASARLASGEALTAAEVETLCSQMQTALLAALNRPVASTDSEEQWYQFHSVRASDYYVTATAAAAGVVGDNTTAEYAQSMWKFVDRGDGSYDIVNRKYETYLNPVATYNTQITTTTAVPAKGWTLSYANTPGCYIISSGEVQLNQTQAGLQYKIYNWSAESTLGQDRSDAGCQFYINEAPSPIEEPQPDETISYTISKTTGDLYNSNGTANATYNRDWKSTATPQLTFVSNANNMSWANDDIQLMSGSAGSATYTLTAPTGYVVDSYSFNVVNNNHDTGLILAYEDGTSCITSTTTQSRSRSGIGESAVTFTLTGTNGKGVLLTNFNVTVKTSASTGPQRPEISTEGNEHWYYITSASTKAYCAGKVMYYDAAADRMRFGSKTFAPDYVWSFWEQNGKLAIRSYNGDYIGTAGAGTGSSTQFGRSETPNYSYTINDAFGYFTIKDDAVELHAQEAGAVIVRWAAAEGGASLWKFEAVDMTNAQAALSATSVKQGKVTTGIGNHNQPIVRATLLVSGLTGAPELQSVSGKVVADDLKDVVGVKAYVATNDRELFVDEEGRMPWREENGQLFGEAATVAADGSYIITGTAALQPGENYLWIAFDIADDATEGNTVDATITGYTVDGSLRNEPNGNPNYAATIFLSEGAALMPYDCGSRYYRIPAITTVKKKLADGSVVDRLVVLTDDRLQHNGDLPNHVYVVAQYSDDLGRSWSQPVRVAGTPELGGDYGHGDASIVTDRRNGHIIGIMTSAGTYGKGFWASTAAQPMLWKTITSEDGGETWSIPTDHTKSLYGVGSPNPTWKGGFSGSGAALQKRDGTLVSSFVNRDANDVRNFHFFMSKDGGASWYVSGTSGTTNADEPKTLERNNGDLSIFVRASGYNYHNVTSDDGQTWHYAPETRFTSGISGTACDGEYMTWCSTLDGNAWDIALETLPNSSSRENVSICLSTDEGETFGAPKTICPWSSGYSTAVVLPDGTLGVYYEEDGYYNSANYVLRFVRFSLDWASNGMYKFTEDNPFHPIPSADYTGVAGVTAGKNAPEATYDLQGRRVENVRTTGVYIKGGKKVLISRP